MTPLEKLKSLGFDKASRILATRVMGWRIDRYHLWLNSDKRYVGFNDNHNIGSSYAFTPCIDLKHAKMIVDKLTDQQRKHWASVLDDIVNEGEFFIDLAGVANSPAEARMAAVMEALNLFPEGERK